MYFTLSVSMLYVLVYENKGIISLFGNDGIKRL